MLKNGLIHLIMFKMMKDLFQLVKKKKKKKYQVFLKMNLGGKIMKEFDAPKAKTYAYLLEDDSEHKKSKGTKKCVIKRELMFENYKNCVLDDEMILKKTTCI